MTVVATPGVELARSSAPLGLLELQLDALSETFNLSLGQAAVAFSRLVSEEIELSVPVVELVSRDAVIERLLRLARVDRLCGITQAFDAASSFHTDTMLLFPEAGSLELARRMLGATSSLEAITELEQDALAEIGNIVINGCMSSIANLFKKELSGTLPRVVISDARTLFTEHCATDQILVARIGLQLAVQDISGYVMFMMDVASIRHFVAEAEQLFEV